MNAIGALILVFLMLVVLLLPRRWAALGMLAGVMFLVGELAVDVAGFNLFPVRFLELAGFARLLIRKEISFSKSNNIDYALIVLYCYTTLIFLLRSSEGQAYQIGLAVDAMLCFFTFRSLIISVSDFKRLLLDFSILLVLFVALVLVESFTAHNPFSLLGANPNVFDFRNGVPRCRGSFTYPDLMGTVGASFLPLYIGMFFANVGKKRAILGIILCAMIVVLSNSGGAKSAAAVGVVGWLIWRMRNKMSMLRRGLVAVLVLLAMVMKSPIWWLPARASDIVGGDGWHRSELIDRAITDLDKWWLAGMKITETRHWFPYVLAATGGADITNQYLIFGLAAGVVSIVLFIFLIVQSYNSLGRALSVVRSDASVPKGAEMLLWSLGVMLTVHVVNWVGVSYFDQIYVVWFMQLSAISSLSQEVSGGQQTSLRGYCHARA